MHGCGARAVGYRLPSASGFRFAYGCLSETVFDSQDAKKPSGHVAEARGTSHGGKKNASSCYRRSRRASAQAALLEARGRLNKMKSLTIGWEVDLADNKPVFRVIPIRKAIIIRTVQMHVAYMKKPAFALAPKPGFAQVLAWGAISNAPANEEFGEARFLDGAPASAHGTENAGYLFSTILKTEVTSYGGAVNDTICLNGLAVKADATNELVLCMAHGGVPSDIEMQGVIFYDVAPTSSSPSVA
jgi:hypothetical protein